MVKPWGSGVLGGGSLGSRVLERGVGGFRDEEAVHSRIDDYPQNENA